MSQPTETDATRLLALHQKVLDAHLQSNVELMLEDEEDKYTIANRGSVTHPTKAERRQRLTPYLRATAFTEYRNEIPPLVTISQDGTLGWIIVQVFARGVQTGAEQTTHEIEFVSAWIELYEKRQNRWWRTGNVSNFKE